MLDAILGLVLTPSAIGAIVVFSIGAAAGAATEYRAITRRRRERVYARARSVASARRVH